MYAYGLISIFRFMAANLAHYDSRLPYSRVTGVVMKGMKSRRDFLRMAATSAGVAAGVAMLPSSIRKALAIPASKATGTIKDVQHVVILMQENRSFDHYFGSMRGVRGFNDPRPVCMPNGKPVWYQPPAAIRAKHYKSR